jgi:alpha-mannosidase
MPYLDPESADPSDSNAGETTPAAPAETDTASEPQSPPRTGWTLVSLIPHDGHEPPADLSESLARSVWSAVSAPWHPSLLSRAAELPRIEPLESPSPPLAKQIRLHPSGTLDRLPPGYRSQAEDAGAILMEAEEDRSRLIRQLQEHLGAVGTPETSDDSGMISLASDFLALGTTHWMLRDLATSMGHPDAVNHEALTREALSGADAWQSCDRSSAVNRLRAAFEVLTQARERFYPVDAYLIDLCLLDPSMAAGALTGPLESQVPISFLASAQAIARQSEQDPERMERFRQAITEGWVDVAGGTYEEAEDALLPIESILWQFRRGAEVYREHLDDRNVETYARRRFGLYTQLPQIAKRFGFRFAIHLGFDGGRFPIRAETKRLWESPDGTSLESLLRPPLAADRHAQGLMVPWRLAATMKNDHVATLPLIHWPAPVADWYDDLRRTAGYSPVLARWVTLNDYFHLTDRPYETFRPDPDSYATPFLGQSASRRDPDAIGRMARHHRLRARLEAAEWLRAMTLSIAASHAGAPSPEANEPAAEIPCLSSIENTIETLQYEAAGRELDRGTPFWAERLARRILAAGNGQTTSHRPGFLVFNPLGMPRRAAVLLPDAALDLRPEGPLRAAQFTDEGVHAVVDLPAFGFAWVPAEANLEVPPVQPAALSARGRTLKNESLEVEIDASTGGIRGVMALGETMPRLGQQLVVTGLAEKGGSPVASEMKCETFEVDYGGPSLVQATASGVIVNSSSGSRIARFVQRYRLWTGRPILEIDVTLSDLDPSWSGQAAHSDPWARYVACRWAWPDPTSMLRRTVHLAAEVTEIDRPETPDALDISTRRQRTALLPGGLPYHQKHGSRMLDTLLIAGSEASRHFRLGVALDLEHPFQAAMDFNAPAPAVPVADGPPALGARGWLIQIDQKSVAVLHVNFLEATGDGRAWGLELHLLETAGMSSRCRVRFLRNPTWARQIDFQGEIIVDLSIDGDAVLVDLTPNELARVEVTLG